MSRRLTVVQARLGSTRFPGKVFQRIFGRAVLELQLERIARSPAAGQVIVATTTDAADDPLAREVEGWGYPVFRGHPTNLLDRHYAAAVAFGAAEVLKIPSDCPLLDPTVIDRVVGAFLAGNGDYCSNLHPATYPDGNDVEIFSFAALERAWREADRDFELEHTTPYLWERPELFRIGNVVWETGQDFSMSHRFTLDYPEDFQLIRSVYEALYPQNPRFGLPEILAFLESHPEVFALNRRYAGVNWYRHHLGELRTVKPTETRTGEQI